MRMLNLEFVDFVHKSQITIRDQLSENKFLFVSNLLCFSEIMKCIF